MARSHVTGLGLEITIPQVDGTTSCPIAEIITFRVHSGRVASRKAGGLSRL